MASVTVAAVSDRREHRRTVFGERRYRKNATVRDCRYSSARARTLEASGHHLSALSHVFRHCVRGKTAERSKESYSQKWNYVRANPVRAELVKRWEDWPYLGDIFALEFHDARL